MRSRQILIDKNSTINDQPGGSGKLRVRIDAYSCNDEIRLYLFPLRKSDRISTTSPASFDARDLSAKMKITPESSCLLRKTREISGVTARSIRRFPSSITSTVNPLSRPVEANASPMNPAPMTVTWRAEGRHSFRRAVSASVRM